MHIHTYKNTSKYFFQKQNTEEWKNGSSIRTFIALAEDQSSVPNGGSQTFVTPVPENLMSLLTSVGRHTYTHTK